MATLATERQLGVFGFLPTTHTQNKCKQNHVKMCPRSLRALRCFTRMFYLHTQTTLDASDIRIHLSYFDHSKTWMPLIGAPCLEENDTDSWMSSLRLWLTLSFKMHRRKHSIIVEPFSLKGTMVTKASQDDVTFDNEDSRGDNDAVHWRFLLFFGNGFQIPVLPVQNINIIPINAIMVMVNDRWQWWCFLKLQRFCSSGLGILFSLNLCFNWLMVALIFISK